MRWRWLTVGAFVAAGCQTLLMPAPSPPTAAMSGTGRSPPPRNARGGLETPSALVTPALSAKVGEEPVASPPRPAASPPSTSTGKEQEALGPPPESEDDPLTLAAESLGRGDQATAAIHLETYVRQHPDQLMFRAQLAELLLRLDRLAESKAQFERFILAAQEATGPPKAHLTHCHTRLMEIAQRSDDAFAEAFHRGVGLLLLVNGPDRVAASREDELQEEILCQAILALVEAKNLRPTDPRTHFYLGEAYACGGNRRAANVALATARNLATPGRLTPTEQLQLGLAASVK